MYSWPGTDMGGGNGATVAKAAAIAANPFDRIRTADLKGCALFLSYSRGHFSTPFANWLKTKLEQRGFVVWMDASPYPGRSADLLLKCKADLFVALIDTRYC